MAFDLKRKVNPLSTPSSIPGGPLDKNILELPPEELKKVPIAAGHLSEALAGLEKDYAFVLRSDFFTSDLFNLWITAEKAHDAIHLHRHSHEFFPTTMYKKNLC